LQTRLTPPLKITLSAPLNRSTKTLSKHSKRPSDQELNLRAVPKKAEPMAENPPDTQITTQSDEDSHDTHSTIDNDVVSTVEGIRHVQITTEDRAEESRDAKLAMLREFAEQLDLFDAAFMLESLSAEPEDNTSESGTEMSLDDTTSTDMNTSESIGMQKTSSPEPPLLGIPVELRCIIYGFLLHNPILGRSDCLSANETVKYDLHPAILRVCSLTNIEARSVWYNTQTFYMFIPSPANDLH
jgi:hypothetical protein